MYDETEFLGRVFRFAHTTGHFYGLGGSDFTVDLAIWDHGESPGIGLVLTVVLDPLRTDHMERHGLVLDLHVEVALAGIHGVEGSGILAVVIHRHFVF